MDSRRPVRSERVWTGGAPHRWSTAYDGWKASSGRRQLGSWSIEPTDAEGGLLMTNTESARALYARTRVERFAIGAFNVDNQETLIAIARAAAARKSPVLVEASHGEVEMI